MTKKAKPTTPTPQGSPASSAPNTPRKSAVAERIAQEKARLKRLEHELSEKLKNYGRQQEEGKDHSLKSPEKPSQSNQGSPDVKTSVGTSSDNSSNLMSQGQEFDSRGASSQFLASEKEVVPSKDSEKPLAVELDITSQQLERIRKLQVSDAV